MRKYLCVLLFSSNLFAYCYLDGSVDEALNALSSYSTTLEKEANKIKVKIRETLNTSIRDFRQAYQEKLQYEKKILELDNISAVNENKTSFLLEKIKNLENLEIEIKLLKKESKINNEY
ncbi:hypothetical protein [Campylobacter sp. RM12651]|uniref:hypothetical protein n=1 Tax=Campylobacter sp. RM12651 TaxID=1660079 RepID=UPI001EFA89C4|nr:hypothetical protein [Campylobacter sp. RM12651]ULO04487.1 hypothetical protein AVBRAN_a0005 [Campylobacter sp. RM12651]